MLLEVMAMSLFLFGFVFRIGRKNWKNTGRNYWVEMRVPPKRRRYVIFSLIQFGTGFVISAGNTKCHK